MREQPGDARWDMAMCLVLFRVLTKLPGVTLCWYGRYLVGS